MKILLVCLGNICRSPLAEGIIRNKSELMNLDLIVDSAGTSDWHIGEPPDVRGINVAFENGIDISNLKARQFIIEDFDKFDLILAMDKANYSELLNLARNSNDTKKIKLFMNVAYPGVNMDVPDPYYDNRFEEVFELLDEASENILEKL
ncbi:MAG TPA: low molecular weight phosphotyrosine protein phosphatase [Bacteroidetes bacterium]|nr:low molecular weight phosphotyrosine protein phosphatase [Bacteroidota bacterium]